MHRLTFNQDLKTESATSLWDFGRPTITTGHFGSATAPIFGCTDLSGDRNLILYVIFHVFTTELLQKIKTIGGIFFLVYYKAS